MRTAFGPLAAASVLASAWPVSAPRAQAPSFQGQQYSVPDWVTAIDVRDLDLDGRPDVVSGNQPSGLTVRRSDPSGTLGPGAFHPYGSAFPYGADLLIADVDADGLPDVAVVCTSGSGTWPVNAEIFRGDVTGTLAAPIVIALQSAGSELASAIAAGDLNGDGFLDLVFGTANVFGTGAQLVLLSDGAGGFLPAAVLAAIHGSLALAVGDGDRDGDADVYSRTGTMFGLGYVALRPGDGAGGFGAETLFPAGAATDDLELADFDGDGILDVATTGADRLYVLAGDGLGGLAAAQELWAGLEPAAIGASDVNGDGALDIVAANAGSDDVSVLAGNGDGTFAWHVDIPAWDQPRALAIADLGADGRSDLALAVEPERLAVLYGDGSGAFAAQAVPSYPAGLSPRSLAPGDYDGDARLDLASADWGGDAIELLLGDGAGGFSAGSGVALGAGKAPLSIAAADVNGDGRLDLATANLGAASSSVLLGDGAGGFGPAAEYAVGVQPERVRLADLDDDGALDLVTANQGGFSTAFAGSLTVRLGDGSGAFGAGSDHAAGKNTYDVALADFDADGELDAVAANASSHVAILLGDGQGGFAPPVQLTSTEFRDAIAVAAGDANGDGRSDFLAAVYSPAQVALFTGAGDGTFYWPAYLPGLGLLASSLGWGNPSAVALADLDRDDEIDFVVTDFGRDCVAVFTGKDASTWPWLLPTGARPRETALGDFDADGFLDLVAANSEAGSVSAFLNTTDSVQAPVGLAPYGHGTAGCTGELALTASATPKPGVSAFAFAFTNVPPLDAGLVFLSAFQDVAGSPDPFGLGLTMHIDLVSARAYGASSDASGTAFAPAPIPPDPALAGATAYAQGFWLEPPSWSCSASPYSLVASRGLALTIQN